MSASAEDDDIWLDPNESPGYLVRDTNIALGKALRRRLSEYGMTLGQYYFMRALWIEERYRREQELRPYEAELIKLQEHLERISRPMIILFEGRDAAGRLHAHPQHAVGVQHDRPVREALGGDPGKLD